jgi:hypothetical protein
MKSILILLLSLMFVLSCTPPAVETEPASDPTKEEWIQLFNGQNLDGWLPKLAGHELNDNYGNTFRVEAGLLKAEYDQYETFGNRFGHLFYKDKFSHYRIAVEHRFVGEQATEAPDWAIRNSGVMLHCQSPQSMLKDQDFPISIEAQLLADAGTGERPTANLCTPGTNVEIDGELITQHCVNSSSKTYGPEEWVRVEIEVLGSDSVRHIIDGKVVMEYQKPQIGGGNVAGHDESLMQDGLILAEGYISLQGESHPVQFRKVELLNLAGCLDSNASNYKSYYVKGDDSLCEY